MQRRDQQRSPLGIASSKSSLSWTQALHSLSSASSQAHLLNGKLNCTRNALVLPGIKAESSTRRILSRCQILQSRSDSQALLKMGIPGITVLDVRGFGSQGGSTDRQAGSEFSEDEFLAKAKMEIVVSKEQVEAVIDKTIEEARTGEIGDGKIFLVPISDVIRVRTDLMKNICYLIVPRNTLTKLMFS